VTRYWLSLRRCSGETRELGRVADRGDLLNVVVGDVQHQRDSGLAVETTDNPGSPLISTSRVTNVFGANLVIPPRMARAIGRAVDEVGQRRELVSVRPTAAAIAA
jgi:hypothetical protein